MEPLLPDDPDRIGPHQLLARLGAGGMGQVYLARSRGGRPVAVKVIHENLAADEGFRARFGREVAAARRVDGVFTAPLVDADAEASVPWLATAYLPALSLTDAVATHGPLPVPAARALGAALAEALDAIHRAGVVHRDLKPPNVLLTAVGPRVIDFGIARAADFSTLTGTGVIIGTPGYLAPEQITGADTGPAVDVFALGALLVYTLTGVGPFGGGNSHELLLRTVTEEPCLDGVVDADLRARLAACLDKAPDRRPVPADLLAAWSVDAPTLDDTRWLPTPIADEIGRAVAMLPGLTAAPWRVPVPASPTLVETGQRSRRLSRRALVAGGLGAVVLAAGGATFGIWWAGRSSGPVRWRIESDVGPSWPGPWLAGGLLLAPTDNDQLQGIDPATGRRRWSGGAPVSTGSVVTAAGGVGIAYAGGSDPVITGFELATGARRWEQPIAPLGTYPPAPPFVAGRIVLAGHEEGGDAAVYGLDPRTGTPAWRTPLASSDAQGVSMAGSWVYAADDEGYVYGIDAAAGVLRWRVRLGDAPTTPAGMPIAAGGRVYVAGGAGQLFALDGRTGSEVWAQVLGGVAGAPMVVGDRIYLPGVADKLVAVNAKDGATLWKSSVGSGYLVVGGQVACVRSWSGEAESGGLLTGISLDDGRTLWHREVEAYQNEQPVYAGDLFHFARTDGVVSLRPATGAVVRTVGEDDGVKLAGGMLTDGTALYLHCDPITTAGDSLCSLTLP
ncbi:PQQ-binding-like beta-propeller repeat protein [Cryptosporangium aurantiacum]|uniref:Serine/threonine protein kinase n=1 Tax=Cryptosporangium aurantiacum TaxID=134849 RepID=A0A1M7RNK8_9ACTN|nr:PQQ-binding-like beta-propeller repeat protein [Cryptosporangium aurantiacum]SHN47682.1 Serine/threonine protein kinase [Cryptosporangium aurantiacum]